MMIPFYTLKKTEAHRSSMACPKTPSDNKALNQKESQVVLPVSLESCHIDFKPRSGVILSHTGPAPMELLGTRATFSLTQARKGNVWSASDFTTDTNSLLVSFFTPASAVIGPYTLKIEISQGQGHSVAHPVGTFILLFNPWNAGMTCLWSVMLT